MNGNENNKEREPEIAQPIEQNEGAAEEPTAKAEPKGISRRSVIAGSAGVAALCALGAMRFVDDTPLVRPPGGQDFANLVGACIKCEKCIEVCPHHVVKPQHIEDGIISLRTPILDFSRDWCNWCAEENDGKPLCVEVCPTGALALPEGATQETHILGIAELDPFVCLAYLDLSCRFCYDACEFDAIVLDENYRPAVVVDKCNGCGACEAECVVFENASISADARERAIVIRAIDEKGNIVNGLPGGGVVA